MEALLGKVDLIEGKFFAEDVNGDVVELKNGDEIAEGMTVYGDSSNSASAMINVAIEGSGEIISLSGSDKQLFDNSLVNVDDETAAGEENVDGSGDTSGVFAARDGSSTDISAGLRDAQFFTDETRVEEDGILLDNAIPLEEVTEPNTVPTVTVDLNVNPNDAQDDAISLTGSSARATTVTVTITDPDGTVVFTKANIPVDADGNWSVPNSELPEFSEDVTYTATAVSRDSDGDISPEAIDSDFYGYNDITPPVLSMNIELDQESNPFTAYAFNGDNFMTGIGQGTSGKLTLDKENGELIYHDLGLGIEENVRGQGREGDTDLGVDDNETLVFDLKSAVSSVTFDLKSVDGVGFDGAWRAFDSSGNEIENTNTNTFAGTAFHYETDGTLPISEIGGFQYIAIDAHDPANSGASDPGFYVNVDAINGSQISDPEIYEYTISLDADLAGSSDIPGDLTDITLSDLPDDVTLHDSLGAEITPVAGVYTVAIDADGKADVTLTSPDLLESTEIDAIDSSVSTTDGYMSVTDSQSDATTLLVSNGSIDFSSLVDDHNSLENIDLDNSTNQVASISLDDVLDMTDNTNELSIVGNDGDTLSIDTSSPTHTWTETGSLGNNVFTYENTTGDSITLTVDDQIDVIGA